MIMEITKKELKLYSNLNYFIQGLILENITKDICESELKLIM